MSAAIGFRDIEMEALIKCYRALDSIAHEDFWKPGEAEAALSAYQKLTKGLNRKSRRRTKS